MMPMPSSDTSRRVHVDANAVIDYIRERTLRNHGMRPTGRRAEVLRVRLEQMSRVYVAATAGMEAEQNLVKDLAQKLGHVDADIVRDTATKLLHEYLDNAGVEDYLGHVPAAQNMYAAISGDPKNRKFFSWRRKKGMFVVDPALGSDANDLVILSTAARHARDHAVELWTHDMDFTMFAGEIMRTFNVKVVDTYRLTGYPVDSGRRP